MRRFITTRHATRTAAPLIAAMLTAATLFATGCGEAEDGGRAQVDGPSAPEISLEAAVVAGDDDTVRAHIMAGTSLNTTNMGGDTPLSVAAVMGRTNAAEVLVGAGAELETKNNSGTTALFNAAFFCNPDVVRVLIDAGADTETTDANGIPIRQVMEVPWEQIEPVYAAVYRAVGIPLDADRIETTRPQIAAMLR